MSKIYVASQNPVKLRAVGRALDQRPDLLFHRSDIIGIAAQSGVSEQPTGEETARGAMNRVNYLAQIVEHLEEKDHVLIGIESGLFAIGGYAGFEARVMDYCVVAIQWKDRQAFGTASGFTLPYAVGAKFFRPVKGHGPGPVWVTPPEKNYTLDDAGKELGITNDPKAGQNIGIVGVLSRGLLSREDYTFEAVRNALFSMDWT